MGEVSKINGHPLKDASARQDIAKLKNGTTETGKAKNAKHLLSVCAVGSDSQNTSGWYKFASFTQTGYRTVNVVWMIHSGYSPASSNMGIYSLKIRANQSPPLVIQVNGWLVRSGINVDDIRVVVNENTATMYVNNRSTVNGRMYVEELSCKNEAGGDFNITYYNSASPETTAPTATKASVDLGYVEHSNKADKLTNALTIVTPSGTKTYDGSSALTVESLKGDKGDTGAMGAKGDKGDKGDTGAAGAGITEISDQYIQVASLDTGLYKLTYNGTIYIRYNGVSTSQSVSIDEAGKLLQVVKNGTYICWLMYYRSSSYMRLEVLYGCTPISGGTSTNYVGYYTRKTLAHENSANTINCREVVSTYYTTTTAFGTSNHYTIFKVGNDKKMFIMAGRTAEFSDGATSVWNISSAIQNEGFNGNNISITFGQYGGSGLDQYKAGVWVSANTSTSITIKNNTNSATSFNFVAMALI